MSKIIKAANVVIEDFKPRTKVAIMGFAPSWKQTPFNDPDFEIWTLNEAYKLFQTVPNGRADRWFEIHNPNSPSKATPEHHQFLRTTNLPVYMWEQYDEFPSSIKFPKEELVKEFGTYFTNSISWMIALAIYEGFEEIHVYGVDMAQNSEYSHQRPSCEYFLGLAKGKGIKIFIPQESDLLKAAQLYGFESDNGMRLKMKERIKELSERQKFYENEIAKINQNIKQMELQRKEYENAIHQLLGGKEVTKYFIHNWMV